MTFHDGIRRETQIETFESLYRVYPKQLNLDLVYLQDHNLE